MKVSIIIPNYNGASLLKRNIPAVFEAGKYYREKTQHAFEIIVSDDASHDESETVVNTFTFPVTFLKHTANVGFASNVNRGVAKATGEIIVLLNSDVSPEKEFLVPLLRHFSDVSIFAVGCLDRSIEKNKEVERGRGIGRWERGFLMHSAGDLREDRTLWASGGSSAFRLSIWKKLGGLLPFYNPFYWEDIDLSYRAQKAGYTVLFEPKSKVVHDHDEGSIKKQFSKNVITATAYRNQFFFVWLNITDNKLVASHLLWLFPHTFRAIVARNGNYLRGLFHAVVHLPSVMKQRYKNKALFTTSDDSVLRKVQN